MNSALVSSPAVIMAPRPDGFEVVWGVTRLSRGWLEWRAGDASGIARSDAFGMVPQSDTVLRIRVSGLPAGEPVQLRAVTEAIADPAERHESEWRTVRTLAPEASTAHFAVWNDTHQQADTLEGLHAATPAELDLLVWNGDLCNDWTTPDQFVETVLNPAELDISAGRPVLIAMGNHDVRGKWAYQLKDFVAMPEGRPYTALRLGPVAMVVLHTGEDKPDDHPTFGGRVALQALRSEQATWLREAIERPEMRDAPYRVVICHIPLRWLDETEVDYDNEGYDSFSKMSRDEWHDSLVEWGAQVVLSGHMHETAWMPANEEFPYAQLVSGGPDADAGSVEAASWIEARADEHELLLTMRDLGGTVITEARLTPQR